MNRSSATLCAIATMVAFVDGIGRDSDAPDDYVLTEFWRLGADLPGDEVDRRPAAHGIRLTLPVPERSRR